MPVLKLVPHKPHDQTNDVLRALLNKGLLGALAGVTICYRLRDGTEKTVYTGLYRDRPAEALRASMRASAALTYLGDDPP